ncbi:hypothetical protein EDP1_2907 [Pseudomonas putida S610]|nr:hypothetical protein EDP1_2907 [Pseudomonas putida S610]
MLSKCQQRCLDVLTIVLSQRYFLFIKLPETPWPI